MAEEQDLEMEEGGGGGKKKLIIIVAVVVLLLGGAGAFFFLGGSDDSASTAESSEEVLDEKAPEASKSADVGSALYVAMPRPFTFNVPGSSRDRLVQIKVQLLVRGPQNEETAKKHIPLIEGTLLKVFSGANADDLATTSGKVAIRETALKEVQKAMNGIANDKIVDKVLFTGFVMQ